MASTPEESEKMTFSDMRNYLYAKGPSIGRMAKAGDKLAIAVYKAYKEWHSDQLNPGKQDVLLRLVKEYILRDCTMTEIDDLSRKYGAPHPDQTAH